LHRIEGGSPREDLARIAAMAVVLAVYLARGRVYEALAEPASDMLVLAANIAFAIRSDLSYVVGLTVGFGAAVWLARRHPRMRHILMALWFTLVGLSVVLALVNRMALPRLGQPISYQWLYYSDFLMGLDAFNTMAGLLSWTVLKEFALKCAAILVLGWLAGRLVAWAVRAGRARILLLMCAATLALYVSVTMWLAPRATLSPIRVQNPVLFLTSSALGADGRGTLDNLPTTVGPDDFLTVAERHQSRVSAIGLAKRANVRNLIIVVLESVAAKYVGPYGGPARLTPEIDAAAAHGLTFTRIYAHVPSTAYSLVSLLLSAYPPHSFRILTREFPRVQLPSLSGELARHGYRTAFFNSADNRFQRGEEFLAARHFDLLVDHRSIPCDQPVFLASDAVWPFADGIRDECNVRALLKWTEAAPGQPFAAILWTMQTHNPYFISGARSGDAAAGSLLSRYLTALHEGDRALGELLRGLDRQGLLDNTLIVVMGDHGEAFGEHGVFYHHKIYDEELHIPLMLINQRLFHGERDSTVGGIIDVSPTLMDLLGYSLPPRWQGRSLFDPDRSGRVYMFAPFSSVYFGYREGERKVIYNANANTFEVYDLQLDPGEMVNLASRQPEAVAAGRERLVAWARYQKRYYAGLLNDSAR
jgi:lipoteichoic acid synthase